MVTKKMFLPRTVSFSSTWADKVDAEAHSQSEGGNAGNVVERGGGARRLCLCRGLRRGILWHGSEEAVGMAWLGGCRPGVARRLSAWHGSWAVAMAWHGMEVVGIAWLGGCRHRSVVVGMAWRLSPWHGL